jgi:hypothetical protein
MISKIMTPKQLYDIIDVGTYYCYNGFTNVVLYVGRRNKNAIDYIRCITLQVNEQRIDDDVWYDNEVMTLNDRKITVIIP